MEEWVHEEEETFGSADCQAEVDEEVEKALRPEVQAIGNDVD